MEQIMLLNQKVKIFLLAIVLFYFLPNFSQAAGLVPCGGPDEPVCEFCHLFVLFNNIVEFVLTTVVPPMAVLMLVIGGIMFFTALGDPNKVTKARAVLQWTIIGLFVIYSAYVIVGAFFTLIGVADWTGLGGGWFEFPCP